MSAQVFPELVTGRRDGFVQGPWEIRHGTSSRGGASCNLSERVLEVPLGDDPASRVVRAHELMHVRVSPFAGPWSLALRDVTPRALECAEELRVNTLLERAGFATALLRDGTEKAAGKRVAAAGDWHEALRFMLAVIGTGGERDYMAGVRTSQPTWMAGLRAVRKRVLQILSEMTTEGLSDTTVNAEGLSVGYVNATVSVARIVELATHAKAPVGADELRRFRRSLEPGGRRAASGRFAVLRFDDSIEREHRSRSQTVRRLRPAVSGTVMRYPGRLLTDDLQRAFASKTSAHGGVVVIDQSGSMDISSTELERLLLRAPNAVVVGYSHRPGDSGETANAWVLAELGGVSTSAPAGNVGNGVDGPILRWAVHRGRGAGPIVWVTDGQVTDSNDHPSDELTEECALLVRKHRISMVRELRDAGRALACYRPFVPSEFGRVGRKLLEIRAFRGT